MFRKILRVCVCVWVFCGNGLVVAAQLAPQILVSVSSPHMTTTLQKSVAQITPGELEWTYRQNPAGFEQLEQQTWEFYTRMQKIKTDMEEEIKCDINGLTARFFDLVLCPDQKSNMAELTEIIDKLLSLSKETGLQKQLIENSDDCKAGLCLFFCRTDCLKQNTKIDQLYQEIFKVKPSRVDALEKLTTNAESWGISDETLFLLEG